MTKNFSYKSSEIFSLIEDIGYSIDSGAPLTDEQLETFISKYRFWSYHRDQAVVNYLTGTKKLFRGYIPFDQRALQTAIEISWYFDELVIYDPIKMWIGAVEKNKEVESAKYNIPQIFQILKRLRYALDEGYLILSGTPSHVIAEDPDPEIIKSLSENSDIIKALNEAIRFGIVDRLDSERRVWKLWHAVLPSGAAIGWVPPNIKWSGTLSSPGYRVGEELPLASYDELKHLLRFDPYDILRNRYPVEIKRTLRIAGLSTYFGSVPVFSRIADGQILAIADGQKPLYEKSSMILSALNLSLPFLHGVPPERILDIREAIPMAFQDFRNTMVELIDEFRKEFRKEQQDIDPEEYLRVKSERKLIPLIRNLDGELKAASRKARILGYGLPTVAALGSLVGCVAGFQPNSLLTALLASPLASVKAAADFKKQETLAQANSVYFLWRVIQLREGIKE